MFKTIGCCHLLLLFSCEENLTQHGQFYTHASDVNLSERVKHDPRALPHPWLILGIPILSSEATSYNMHVIDAIMRCSFELDEKKKKKKPHRRTQAFLSFQNNYSPMLTRFSLCCVETPDLMLKWMWFLVFCQKWSQSLVMACTLKSHTFVCWD